MYKIIEAKDLEIGDIIYDYEPFHVNPDFDNHMLGELLDKSIHGRYVEMKISATSKTSVEIKIKSTTKFKIHRKSKK